jgi:hypothetical protein
VALPCSGLIFAMLAAVLVLGGLWLQRRAYKPLRDGKSSAATMGK